MTLLEALSIAHSRPLTPGTRVRITDRTGVYVTGDTGTVMGMSGGLVAIQVGNCPQLLTRAQVERMDPETVTLP